MLSLPHIVLDPEESREPWTRNVMALVVGILAGLAAGFGLTSMGSLAVPLLLGGWWSDAAVMGPHATFWVMLVSAAGGLLVAAVVGDIVRRAHVAKP